MTSDQFGPQHSEKPIGFHDKPMSFWQRIPVRTDTGGVSPMYLEGREQFVNERMRGMTPERRAWRKQWLHDQVLSPREPVEVPQLYTELNNPIKRFLYYPFRKIEKALTPHMGWYLAQQSAKFCRACVYGIPFMYAATYYFMFCTHDWTHINGGIKVQWAKPLIIPGDPNYPFTSSKQPDDYHSFGFKETPWYKKWGQNEVDGWTKS